MAPTRYDVFNGDADGLCALQQLRLAEPGRTELVTGVKRDTRLLRRVLPAPGDVVTVLDVSLDSNREDLARVLSAGARVTYFDHHFSGEVPAHPSLDAHLSAAADTCTSLLVDAAVDGAQRLWALVGAAGDNLEGIARSLGDDRLTACDMDRLCELGRLLNYNGYGRAVEDLHFPPDALFRSLHPYPDPRDFIAADPSFLRLRDGYASDMARASEIAAHSESAACDVYVLPDEPWARRFSGELANRLVRETPGRAHAVLVPNSPSCYLVSVRTAVGGSRRADEFCRQFDTGGGRAGAGGINHLAARDLDRFLGAFRSFFS